MFVTPGSRAARKRSAGGGGGTPGGTTLQVQYNNAGAFGGMSGTSWDDTNRALTMGGSTITTAVSVINLGTVVYNNAGVAFPGIITGRVTRTSEAANSRVFSFWVDATESCFLTANDQSFNCNNIVAGGGTFNGATSVTAGTFQINSTIPIQFSNGVNLNLKLEAITGAGVLGLSYAAAGAGFQVYNTIDTLAAPVNYERGVFDWTTTANTLTIGTQAGGTGAARNVRIVSTGAGADAISAYTANGKMFWQPDNAYFQVRYGYGFNSFDDTLILRISAGWVGISTSGAVGTHDGSLTCGWINWAGEARVTSNFTSSTATLTAITGVSSVGLLAARNYAFKAWLAVTGSSLAGVQIGITCSSSTITTLLSDGYALDAGVIRGSSVGVINSTGTPVVAVSSATITSSNPSIRIDGMIRVASSGTFGLTVAQSTASATQTIVSSGSYMIVYDMP